MAVLAVGRRTASYPRSDREATPNFWSTAATWCSTVLRLMNSRAAISPFESPSRSKAWTSASRSVSPLRMLPGPGPLPAGSQLRELYLAFEERHGAIMADRSGEARPYAGLAAAGEHDQRGATTAAGC